MAVLKTRRHDQRVGRGLLRLVPYVCVVGVCMAAFAIGGCGGGGAAVRSEVRSTTVGQELMDLQRARDSGVITPDEYEKQREKILKRK
jgi:hypothetical protein